MIRPWALAALLVGCASESEPASREATTAEAVTSGTPDDGDLAVVGVAQRGAVFCTGTVIAPRVVLTAAHCALAVDRAELGVRVGATRFAIADAVVHPDYGRGDSVVGNDLSLLLLDEDAPVARAAFARGADDGLAAETKVTIVGFGLDSPGDDAPPQRRTGNARVTQADATTFDLAPDPSQPCNGDSGGPVFATIDGAQVLVGVTSYGDRACAAGGVATRLGPYVDDFVRPYLDAVAVGRAPGAQGSACRHDVECAGGICAGGACTRRCFPDDAPACACVASDRPTGGFVCAPEPTRDGGCGSGSGAHAMVLFLAFGRRRKR